MKRNTRAEKAQETLQLIEQGFYNVDSERISIKAQVDYSLEHTLLYRSDAFDDVLADARKKADTLEESGRIVIKNTTVLEAAAEMTTLGTTVGCLNFASAKNPGGGFLGGAQAQEESLAMSSALYPTLMKCFEMYEYNRARPTLLYSDHMIYSPAVPVLRDDEGALLQHPYCLSFITSPAVNIGAIKNNRPEELTLAKPVMLARMEKVLALFVHHNIKHLLLGAWGCGVFQNDPEDIASYFASFIGPGGKYAHCFDTVVFAVLDRHKEQRNITAFQKAFGVIPEYENRPDYNV